MATPPRIQSWQKVLVGIFSENVRIPVVTVTVGHTQGIIQIILHDLYTVHCLYGWI